LTREEIEIISLAFSIIYVGFIHNITLTT